VLVVCPSATSCRDYCVGFILWLPLAILRPMCWFNPTDLSCYTRTIVLDLPYSSLLLYWDQCVGFTYSSLLPCRDQCVGFNLRNTAPSFYTGTSLLVSPCSSLLLYWDQCIGFTYSSLLLYWDQCVSFTLQLPPAKVGPVCWFDLIAHSCYTKTGVMVSSYTFILLY
jgi:hypothetical protein